jgi:hypothetical protein
MKRVLLLLSFISTSIFSMELEKFSYADNKHKMYIEPFSVRVPERLGELDVYHSSKGFYIRKDDKKKEIKRYNMDPMLRDITKKQLTGFLANGYLAVNKTEDGQYLLKAKQRLNGGGPIGAAIGVFLGKAAVSVVGHGTIFLIGALTGPAAPVTIIALESCFGAAIESASMAGAVAGGIALGVATGPV